MSFSDWSDFDRIVARFAGGVLLVFGIGLAVLAVWLAERQFAVRGSIQPSVAVVVTIFFAISAFCSFTGYRLALNRPNRYGSLLSPTGWKILTACFVASGAALASDAVWRGKYSLLLAAAALGLLGYCCVLARRGVRLGPLERSQAVLGDAEPSPVFPPDTSLLRMEGFVPAGFRWGIEILNDERTPMEFVVSVLRKAVGLSRADAIRTMLEIHRKGGVLLARGSFDDSRRIADAVAAEARINNHPLICRAVSLE